MIEWPHTASIALEDAITASASRIREEATDHLLPLALISVDEVAWLLRAGQ